MYYYKTYKLTSPIRKERYGPIEMNCLNWAMVRTPLPQGSVHFFSQDENSKYSRQMFVSAMAAWEQPYTIYKWSDVTVFQKKLYLWTKVILFNFHMPWNIILLLIFSNHQKMKKSLLVSRLLKNRWWLGFAPRVIVFPGQAQFVSIDLA